MALNEARVIVIQQPVKKDHKGVERPSHDYSAASAFGKVEILAQNNKMILTPDVFRQQIEEKLEDFNPDYDFIITTGDDTVLFFVGMIVAGRHERVRVLRWVPAAKSYQPITLNIGAQW